MQLFCSFCATFTLNICLSLSEGGTFGYLKLGSPGLVNFGIFGKVWCVATIQVFPLYAIVASFFVPVMHILLCRMQLNCGMPIT